MEILMVEFLSVLIIFSISFVAIAFGVVFNNKPITGSCGGLANLEDGAPCEICGRTTIGDCDN
ncbi:MAG: (Na+)-NQR maturation NqrM [SAR86 cluster bacterium]|nr:(Na+)-NQR maturation NqrM [SAR86 cluster bacterium]MDG2346700.1 (Na+)-NQR maturation NqrM [SAR86 cluster bacterium]